MAEEEWEQSLETSLGDPVAAAADSRTDSPLQLTQQAFQAHGQILFRLALAECRDPELANDAIQEAFLRYHRALLENVTIRSVRAWLARVVINYLRDEARRVSRHAPLSTADDMQEIPATNTAVREMEERIRELLSRREYECIQLRALGYQYEEIAEILAIRPGSVACLLSRALRKLQELRRMV